MLLMSLLGMLVVSLTYTFVGWRCWTGRWRFWLDLPVRFIEAWWPLGLLVGGLFSIFLLGVLLGTFGEVVAGPQSALGSTLIAVATPLALTVFLLVPMLVVAGNLLFVEEIYRKKPNGSRSSRLFLPRWYHQELQRRVAAVPDLGSGGAHPPDRAVPPRYESGDRLRPTPPTSPASETSPPPPPGPGPAARRPPPPGAPRG